MKYCKPELSFSIFTSYERSECFIFGVKRKMLHNEVASSEKAGPDWVKHACRRMKHFAALPQNMKHRRCGMKQSLFRLHVFFALKSRQKKWRRERDSNPRTVARRRFSKPVLSATQPPLRVAAVLKLLLHNLYQTFTYLEARRMPSSVVRER